MRDLALRALDAVTRRGVTYADVRAIESRERDIITTNGKAGHVSSSESFGVGIRVLAFGCWGFAATDDLTGEGVESAVLFALDQFCLVGYPVPLHETSRRAVSIRVD